MKPLTFPIRSKVQLFLVLGLSLCMFHPCLGQQQEKKQLLYPVRLITLDPGHFHSALIQKTMYPQIDSIVQVYAPEGKEVNAHLELIKSYNTRQINPTSWNQQVYIGADYFSRMLEEKKGNVVVLAGKNDKKAEYIKKSIEVGLNVLADKPMAINEDDFLLLKEAFETAQEKKLVVYDIMTSRYDITNILLRELSCMKGMFGTLERGTENNPAVIKESTHHFLKQVSGVRLVRPAWYFDVEQQGNGITDITTHLVDLIQWVCFPEVPIDYKKDVQMHSARQWPTQLTLEQFKQLTQEASFPAALNKNIEDGILNVFSNGSMNYSLKGVHARVSVKWDYAAPQGAGDTHYSLMRGTKANLLLKQGKEQDYKPVLYIKPVKLSGAYLKSLENCFIQVQKKYPGVTFKRAGDVWEVVIPEKYHTGHEAHFGEVTRKFLSYLQSKELPKWEIPNMIAKYYTTIKALELAKKNVL